MFYTDNITSVLVELICNSLKTATNNKLGKTCRQAHSSPVVAMELCPKSSFFSSSNCRHSCSPSWHQLMFKSYSTKSGCLLSGGSIIRGKSAQICYHKLTIRFKKETCEILIKNSISIVFLLLNTMKAFWIWSLYVIRFRYPLNFYDCKTSYVSCAMGVCHTIVFYFKNYLNDSSRHNIFPCKVIMQN